METPTNYGNVHYIDKEKIKDLCFQLSNMFSASKVISEEFIAEIEDESDKKALAIDNFPIAKLHSQLIFPKTSEILLNLAILIRTYDDQMKDSLYATRYKVHLNSVDKGDYIGVSSDAKLFKVRQACNKIIHASKIRPIYEQVDLSFDDPAFTKQALFLTGEIDLEGLLCKKSWSAQLHVQQFLETVLCVISFK
jgi:hypothetical protein